MATSLSRSHSCSFKQQQYTSSSRRVASRSMASSRGGSPSRRGMGVPTTGQIMKYLACVADREVQIDIFREMLCSSPDFDPYKLFAHLDTDAKGSIDSTDLWEFVQRNDPTDYFPISASNGIIGHYDHSALGQLNYRDFLRLILPWRSSAAIEKSLSRGGGSDHPSNETIRCFSRILTKEAEYMTELNTRKEYLLARSDFSISEAFNHLDSFLNLGLLNVSSIRQAFLRSGVKCPDCEACIARMDRDGDSKVTYAEFRDHFVVAGVSSPASNRSGRINLASRSVEMKSMWRVSSGDTTTSSRRSVRKKAGDFTTPQMLYTLRSVRDLGRRDNKIDRALAHIGFGMSIADCRVVLNYYNPNEGTLNFTEFVEMVLPTAVEARKATVIREKFGMENPEGLPDVCLLERFSGPIEKLFAALFEEASAAQELIVNEDSLRIGFSELDTLGTGVIDTSVLLSALDKNGLQASLAEQAAVPNASKNFLALAASGYYDGTKFHRLMPGFMVQVIEEIVIHANPIADQEAGASGDRHRHRSYERRPRSYGDDERRSRRREDDDRDYHRRRGSSDRRGGRGWKDEEVEEKKDLLRGTKREKSEEKEEKKEEKEKPNFEVSGLLAEEQNSKNGIALMFSQPADAAMPTDAWRLYENRDEAQNGDGDKILHIHRKSCYLFGKDWRLTDCNDEAPLCFIPIDHPTCSRQHAVIQFRLVGDVTKPYLLDLGGKNGTFVNEKRVPAAKYYELREGDLIKFAHSSKSYVLLSAGPLKSKEDKKETDEDGEIDFDVLEDSPQLETSRGTMLGYADDKYEYRHVILPKRIAKDMFRIFQAEAQMRGRPEPHILLFRRPLGTNPLTGQVDRVPGEMQPPPQANIVR
ncbi:Cyclin-dependent kinases regulatory subunit 2 [Perkinsus olseni]|uniref:Cyclin-dependent kinases regulatory subunit 2 n=1 Tax=Perkinsus olseni TaxID=32597 RepID=A0A7J6NIA0_PEROL|nr:Cyclin-dependent kinases regulatory subunit 2 [Perkinsus olseni]